MHRTIVLTGIAAMLAATSLALAVPARAQIGTIFSDPVPRPPGNIPRRGEPIPPPEEEEEVPELPQGRVLPAPTRPAPGPGAALPGPVQSQPLAPPPGTAVPPTNAPVAVAPPPGQPGAAPPAGGQRQPPRGAPQNAAVPPNGAVPQTPATLQPGDEVVTEPPAQKIVNKKASFSGLDKITGRIINFDEDVGETVQFGALRVKTDACYTRPATEAANTDAFVQVDEITLQGEVKRIFSGWMFAASPGLHGVEHPIYDIWLVDCKEPQTTVVSAAPDQKPAAQQPAQKRPPQQRQAAPRPQAPPQQYQTQQMPPPPPPPQAGGPFGGVFR
ncbi:MAG: DUF2155 domain-containing protein [Bradyrhizobium sp.]|jgi:hypothetical protein|uniref:DUF2155 domain-containing protein n=4 Tax=Bradyrhizobium TaxID=374 RepID=A0ABS5G6C1_9BRAD|nr:MULTISPECIES: DUF2155 domain-containing protein [Bradyrhizobium]RTL93908.1 MAG: DUF2155 domain-containing protein [Bradyrhizobiaceae bacterium]MBR1136851.1 DUF2155 domain-containing protein [Bradyrhizobium denitrificans]MCL8487898.1 DUF2155 domain-containing protein [Bradyrhizobium denitrificans]MDU0953791.1 DUF2155 domain-containing protein [Bradyrhizobium sp.]MDU1493063.1 DUF2155 domain-containing protein [Bradyrhizobium sp.]